MDKDKRIAELEQQVVDLKETVQRKHDEAWSWFHTYADTKQHLDRTQEWLDRF